MIKGEFTSHYKTPKSLVDCDATYRFIGTFGKRSLEGNRVLCDVYLSVSSTDRFLNNVFLYDRDKVVKFCPYFHTCCLDIFNVDVIGIVSSVYLIGISKGYLNSDDTTSELFGLEGIYDMSLGEYLAYIGKRRRALDQALEKVKNSYIELETSIADAHEKWHDDIGQYTHEYSVHVETPLPFMVVSNPCALLIKH